MVRRLTMRRDAPMVTTRTLRLPDGGRLGGFEVEPDGGDVREVRLCHAERQVVDEATRTVEITFSSEFPVERFFGVEILGHKSGEADLSLLNDGAPLLFNHNRDLHIGTITKAWIKSRRGHAIVRFGNGELAEAKFRDVVDGVLTKVSARYDVKSLVLLSEDNGEATYRVADWQPFEISMVTLPADPTVGVGRAADDWVEIPVLTEEDDMNRRLQLSRDDAGGTGAAAPAPIVTPAPTPAQALPAPAAPIDREAELATMRSAETERTATLRTLTREHGLPDTMLDAAMADGSTADEYTRATLAFLRERSGGPAGRLADPSEADNSIGMTPLEIGQYSFLRAMRAVAFPNEAHFQEAASLEREASAAAAEHCGIAARGIMVPMDVLHAPLPAAYRRALQGQRDLSVGTLGAGGYTVATDLLASSFIELLRNRMAVIAAGATLMTDLVGNVSIPSQTGAATAFWLTPEGTAPTESQQAFGQVALDPKTVGAFTDYTRQLLLQSSIDIEGFVRDDLSMILALAIDLAALYGSGAAGQPLGIANTSGINSETFAAAGVPTWAEMVGMESKVDTANALMGNLNYMVEPTMKGTLKTTPKEAGQATYIWDQSEVNGYPPQVSSQLTAGDAFFANWRDLLIGMWGGLDITVDPFSLSTTGTTRIVAFQSVDVAVRHPVSFTFGQ